MMIVQRPNLYDPIGVGVIQAWVGGGNLRASLRIVHWSGEIDAGVTYLGARSVSISINKLQDPRMTITVGGH